MATEFFHEYSRLSDDELLEIASDRLSLTDDAQSALDAEMSTRDLTLADVQEHQRFVERNRQRETWRQNRKVFGSRRDRQTKIEALVSFFWLALGIAVVVFVYLSLPRQYRLSADWEETALFVMLGSGCMLVVGTALWRKVRYWLSLLVSSTCHALLVHAWIVRGGSLADKSRAYGDLAILAGPVLFAVVYGFLHQLRRKLDAEDANQEQS